MDRTPTSPRRWLESPRGWKDRSFKRDNTSALRPLEEREEHDEPTAPNGPPSAPRLPPKLESGSSIAAAGAGDKEERKSGQLSNEQQRNFLAQEILSTEQAYVDHLILLIKIYKQPLFHILGDKELSKRFPDETDLKTLFSNVDAIHKVNAALKEELETRLSQWKADDPSTHLIGDVFSKMVPFLSIYTDYCANYVTAAQHLRALEGGYPDFALWVKERVSRNSYQLLDLLILPVQRIPRYRMLLESMVKVTDAEHADYAPLKAALTQVEMTADRLNEYLRRTENQRRLVVLAEKIRGESPIEGSLVQPHRRLMSEHSLLLLEKKSRKDLATIPEDGEYADMNGTVSIYNERPVLCLIFNDIFAIFERSLNKKGEADDETDLFWLDCFPLVDSFLKPPLEQRPPQFSFNFINPRRTLLFRTATSEDKEGLRRGMQVAMRALLSENPGMLEKRRLVSVTRNSLANVWDAIVAPPAFTERVAPEELQERIAEDTRNALEELLEENKDFFDARPVFSPSKKDLIKGFKGLFSVLSPKKGKRSTIPARSSKPDTPAKSRRSRDDGVIGFESQLISMEIEKWSAKCGTPSKATPSKATPNRATPGKFSKRSNAKSPVKSPFKRKQKGHESASKRDREGEMEHLRSLSDGAVAQGMKRRLELTDERDEDESTGKKSRMDQAGEDAEVKYEDLADVPSSVSAPNLAQTVIQIRSPRDGRSPAAFRNAPKRRPNVPMASIPLSPNKKTASPKPVFAHKENTVNSSPNAATAGKEARSPLSPKSPTSPRLTRTPTMRHSLGAPAGVNSPIRKLNFSVL